MAGTRHDVLVAILREQPEVLASLVRIVTGRAIAPGLAPVDSTVRFVKVTEVRPDVLLADKQRWVLLEVQNECDPDKQRRWLLAAGVLLDQKGVMGDVIVVTAQKSVATWAMTVAHVETALGTKLELTPVVLHVNNEVIERLLTEEQPELALVATWAVSHRHGPKAKRVVERAFEVTNKLPEALQAIQFNAIVSLLSARMLAWLKETAMDPNKIPMSKAALKFKASLKAEGLAEGLAEGRTEGRTEGKQGTLLAVLQARGFSTSEKELATIQRCEDPAQLDAWAAKAVTASSVQEVLATKPRRVKSQPTKRRSTAASRLA